MRIAVLSDIHSNLPALEAILEALSPYDAVWQLGDVVGYGPQPNEVVARLESEGATGVRGNHDSAALGELPTDTFNDEARVAVEWTAGELGSAARAWLSARPRVWEQDGFTLVHGSPRDPTWEYVYTVGIARANFAEFATHDCLVGHTHVPLVFRENNGRVDGIEPAAGDVLALDARRTIVNPGSVGQPRDGDPRACGMILDTAARTVEWRRVPYEVATVQRLMGDVGLPQRLIARLEFGL